METKTDVNQVSSPEIPTGTSVTTQEVADPGQQQVDVSNIDASFPAPGTGQQPVQEEVDETGVPYKNRYMEAQRKLEKTSSEVAEMKGMLEQIAASQTQKQEEQKYTIADLEAYKTQNPQYAAWCEQEKARLIAEQSAELVRSEFQKQQEVQKAESIKQQALASVARSYPEVFKKDQAGNVIGWDTNNPMTQSIMRYGQDPNIANRPDGLLYAAKLAAGDIYAQNLQRTQQQVADQQATIGDLQRKTAVEGGGTTISAGSPRVAALQSMKQTGSRADARAALGVMFKDAGILE